MLDGNHLILNNDKMNEKTCTKMKDNVNNIYVNSKKVEVISVCSIFNVSK